ncbi:MAG: hypothetical protein U0531_07015 [Dehalococcoidia bacterium]
MTGRERGGRPGRREADRPAESIRFDYLTLDMDRSAERDEAHRSFSQTQFPCSVLVDPSGNVRRRMLGEQGAEALR